MANDLNRHECIGRLGKDPELKFMPSGEAVANISIACGKSWKVKESGQKQERTTWVRYVAFGKLAEIIGEYLKKGSKVYLSGELRVRKWQAQDGSDRYSTEIVASEMQMLDARGDDQQQQPQQQAPQQQPQQAQQPQQPSQQTQQPAQQQSAYPPQCEFEDSIPF